MGVTSSDIIDTALSIQLKQSTEIIKGELKLLISELRSKALKYKMTPCIGRSHGILQNQQHLTKMLEVL